MSDAGGATAKIFPRIQRQIVVRAPVDVVFQYVADLLRHPEWAAQRLRLEQTSPAPIQLGSTFNSAARQLGLNLRDRVTVSEYVPNQAFAYDSDGDLGLFRHYFRFLPEGNGTRILYGALLLKGPLYVLIPAPPVWFCWVPIALGLDLRRIKKRIESGLPKAGRGEE